MTTATISVSATNAPSFARRRSRTLVGWLPEAEGALWIAGRQIAQNTDPQHLAICAAARDAVSRRAEGCDQRNMFSDLPDSLRVHVESLRAHPKSAQLLAEAGEPRMVDLRKVCAAQPTVLIDDAVARVSQITGGDLLAIAAITLPLHVPTVLPAAFDSLKNAFILSSPNPNLRVAGHFTGEIQPGVTGFGFIVEVTKSYLQVAGVGGRYFLRDGYHRAYGMLAAGMTQAPALVRDYATIEEANMPAGLLSPATYLGTRPPMLSDYIDPIVAADSSLPVLTKMIAVQALELSSVT